ncbi:MAG: alpha-1,2-fucosyltransferase [Lachnospiraceae bacterium]|nr:alpha-1,2-fucosyltransferase [Lachnospiraceae bacterium]
MKIMIWGCGRFGKQAYYYYNQYTDIVGFVDSDKNKWGTWFFDKEIYPPKALEGFKGKVVIAVKNNYEDIQKTLQNTYGIYDIVLFKVEEQPLKALEYSDECEKIDENTIMVYFLGGLGNQMFQYALAKNYLRQGKHVIANIETYLTPGNREFVLCDVFNNIALNFGGDIQKNRIIEKNSKIDAGYKNFRIHVEDIRENRDKTVNMALLNITSGILCGYYQNYYFVQQVANELRKDFTFNTNNDEKLVEVKKRIQEVNCVGVHIRRGDYVTKEVQPIYGGICTQQYYDRAIKIMKDKLGACTFCFFSNDMGWVKECFKIPDAIFIESNMFENYQDWYDMYLMSCCKHNIIANSSFSWWGAWLNQNDNKIVIAPKRWINLYEQTDICAPDWILI